MKDTSEVRKLKRNTILFVALINLIIIISTYIIMPVIFNYPPYAEANLDFQNEVESFNHVQQYEILFVLLTGIFSIIINILMKEIYDYLNKFYRNEEITLDETITIRHHCLNIPYVFYITEIIVSFLIGLILTCTVLESLNIVILKFALLLITILPLISLLQFIYLQKIMKKIILITFQQNAFYKKDTGIRMKFSTNLTMQVIPFLLASIIIISLVGYARTTQEKGNTIMNYYKAYMDNKSFTNLTIEDLKNELNTIPLYERSDFYIIIGPQNNQTYISNSKHELSKFFMKYLEYFFDKTGGMVYEYYGTDQQAYLMELKDSNGNSWYIGFEYSITDYSLMVFYMKIILGVSALYFIFINIWAHSISTSISTISESLEYVLKENDAEIQRYLPILSNDEFGDLAYCYNKIEELTNLHLKEIQDNQDILVEQERLASLGQMIGRNCS